MFTREFSLSGLTSTVLSPVDCGVSFLRFPYYSFHMVEKAIFKDLPNLNSLSFDHHSFDGNWGLNHENIFELQSTLFFSPRLNRHSKASILFCSGLLSSLSNASPSFPFSSSFRLYFVDVGVQSHVQASIDRYAFMSVYRVEIGDSVNPELTKALLDATPYVNRALHSDSNATSFTIGEKKDLICDRGAFNMVRSIDFSQWSELETIRIGGYSFKNLDSIELIGLPKLQSVEVEYSGFPFFDDRTYDELEHAKKPFRMCDCPNVTYLVLGTETLSAFTSLQIESGKQRIDSLTGRLPFSFSDCDARRQLRLRR